MMIWIFRACRFVRALRASQADRPQDASVDFGLCRSVKTASYENGIVTLRGGACLVGAIAKIAIDCQKIVEIEKQDLEPQRTRRNTEANPHRGDAEEVGHWDKRELQSSRRFPQTNADRKQFSAEMRPALSFESMPGNPILAGSDLGNVKRR